MFTRSVLDFVLNAVARISELDSEMGFDFDTTAAPGAPLHSAVSGRSSISTCKSVSLPRAGKCSMTPLRFTGARPRLGQGLETVALSGAELEVRIHSPPADSPSLSGFRLRPRERRGYSAILAAMRGGSVGRDTQSPATSGPRRGSVSVGRYSSTAAPLHAVCEIGAPGANEVGLATSVGLGFRIGSSKAEQGPLIVPGQWQT